MRTFEWVNDESIMHLHRVYIRENGVVMWAAVLEWIGPGEPPEDVIEELKRRIETE